MLDTVLYALYGLGGLGLVGLVVWTVRSVKRWGAAQYKAEQAEKERDAAQDEAQDLANRPRTLDDRVSRLQLWKRKLKK